MKQEEFYQKLSEVPPFPDPLYSKIERKINRKRTLARMIWALAACVILAVGITSYTLIKQDQPTVASTELSQEVIDELQIIHDFLNGNTVDDELDMYALVDMEIF